MTDIFLTDKDKSELSAKIETKAPKGHKHTAEELDGGVIDVKNGGTGAKTAEEALEKLGALARAGGIMMGPLSLSGLPTSDSHAVPKKYADEIEKKGLKIETGTYEGVYVNTRVEKTLNFTGKPYLVFMFSEINSGDRHAIASRTAVSAIANTNDRFAVFPITWGEKSLTMTATDASHMCNSGQSYNYIAFCI